MLKFIKSLFTRKAPVIPAVVLAAQGEIARKVSELFTVTLVHTGGDEYEIHEMGNYTKTGTIITRFGEHRAKQHFSAVCGMCGAK